VKATLGAVVLLCFVSAGCVDTLPDQDRRIYQAVPVAKISADILWKEYSTDAAAADRLYKNVVLEISGNLTAVIPGPPHVVLMFGIEDQPGVRATVLDDEAEAIMARAKVGDRLTLRCYCEGLDESVRLKSCIERR